MMVSYHALRAPLIPVRGQLAEQLVNRRQERLDAFRDPRRQTAKTIGDEKRFQRIAVRTEREHERGSDIQRDGQADELIQLHEHLAALDLPVAVERDARGLGDGPHVQVLLPSNDGEALAQLDGKTALLFLGDRTTPIFSYGFEETLGHSRSLGVGSAEKQGV